MFFARGGQVVYPCYHYVRGGGYTPFSSDKGVAEEIAKLHFVFHPSKELEVEFHGIGISPKKISFSDNGESAIDNWSADSTMTVKGWVNRLFPSGSNFVSLDEEGFCDALFKDIQSRITPGAEFELDRGNLWGNESFQVQKRPIN